MINGYEELPKDIKKHVPNYEYWYESKI
jgi:hypothetical protein